MINLKREDWTIVLTLLGQALELPANEYDTWLFQLDSQFDAFKPVLRKLLDNRQSIENHHFLSTLPSLPIHPNSFFEIGMQIGPYTLIKEIGQGGMASVWLARRTDEAHKREVALKLPYIGLQARMMGERFSRERNILSSLNHPHIASVLDAGADHTQPWLAMEFVDGLTITEYASLHQLDIKEKLTLFLQVLTAVQHAHAQLIIHRDIKPSNVLVDSDGQVKLLDFGVAKLLSDDTLYEQGELTRFSGLAMTPQYASPEQLTGKLLGTASDTYSLGVLLYKLLTENLPYIVQRKSAAALEDAIVNAQIKKPSAATNHSSLQRALRGDIDTIVMKALATHPSERYLSAEAFSRDIKCYLQSQPIQARPLSTIYWLRKFIARNRVVIFSSAVLFVGLVSGLTIAIWQANEASKQAARAQAVQHFLINTLQGNDPENSRGKPLTARELLDKSASNIAKDFKNQPEIEAQLNHTVGSIYIALGEIERSRPYIEKAIRGFESMGKTGDEQYLFTLFNLTEILDELRDYDAEAIALKNLEKVADHQLGTPNRFSAKIMASQAWLEQAYGRNANALLLAEKALALQRHITGEASLDYLSISGALVSLYTDAGQLEKARSLLAQAVKLGKKTTGYEITSQLMDGYALARITFRLNDFATVETMMAELLPRFDQHIGPRHDRTLIARSLYAQALMEQAHYEEGIKEQRMNVQYAQDGAEEDDEGVELQRITLAKILKTAGQYEEGISIARSTMAYFEHKYSTPNIYRERNRWILGELLIGFGKTHEGIQLLEDSIRYLKMMSDQKINAFSADSMLSLALARQDDPNKDKNIALAAQTCPYFDVSPNEKTRSVLRCKVIESWLIAKHAKRNELASTRLEFIKIRDQLLPLLPINHALRAELLAAESTLLNLDPQKQKEATLLRQKAETMYQKYLHQNLPNPLLVWR